MNDPKTNAPQFGRPNKRGWAEKFRCAGLGLFDGVRGQNSFWVHLPVAFLVIAASVYLRLSLERIAILLLCIAMVLGAELFNSSLEHLSRAITREYSEDIRRALDIASGAVLLVALFASAVGVLVLLAPWWVAV